MSISAINTALYRPIKSNSKYDKYFEKVSCVSTFLGEATTTVGLQLMSDWAKKYQYQTKQISKELKGNTLHKTVNNVYNFLYQHIQYQADGYEQELKSPACSWKMRFTGIDCKSYSLFASTILSNLNIAHKFRKVVQPSAPDRWSHVYVIIENGGKELVIDGANHFNKEVEYLQKHDMEIRDQKLPYYGMNSAFTKSFMNMDKAVRNFIGFLDELKIKHGLSPQIANQIKYDAKRHLDKGVEPRVLITKRYVQINQNRHYLNLTPSGLGFLDFGGSNDKDKDDDDSSFLGDLIDAINVGNFIDRGFGQVFDNGFDFSCWRASFPPSLAESETKAKIQDMFVKSNLRGVVQSLDLTRIKLSANRVIRELQLAVNDRYALSQSRKGCTKKGETESYKLFKAALDKLYVALDSDFKINYITVDKPVNFTFRGGSITRNTTVKEISTISLKNKPVTDTPTKPVTVDDKSGTGKPKEPKNNSKILGTLATILGGGFLLFK
ncbi:transglutaminase-like domain-containing protein [uncultured Tenacibaculum sp.]|uniref:transglutaminase-like domain-containing protein n=1 Tax=uncultured Tenacibaculum sp. TaxID=174713 RepID=UPI00262287F1|nr:transglutaminase-like domain-containing protein [uncultured Tenacibaculum sp.]